MQSNLELTKELTKVLLKGKDTMISKNEDFKAFLGRIATADQARSVSTLVLQTLNNVSVVLSASDAWLTPGISRQSAVLLQSSRLHFGSKKRAVFAPPPGTDSPFDRPRLGSHRKNWEQGLDGGVSVDSGPT
jgi:hypothetical protein